MPASRPIILCALRFELKRLAHQGVGDRCELHCCGPGASAVAAWANDMGAAEQPIILAGLAGALRPGIDPGTAHVITGVCSEKDDPAELWHPTIREMAGTVDASPQCTVVSCGSPVTGKEAKWSLAARTGADLVDMESVAFATAASSLSWRWGIIRGVSDDASSDLPEGLERWIDASGRLRAGKALTDTCCRPGVLGPVMRLRRDGIAAMRAVAGQIARLLETAGKG